MTVLKFTELDVTDKRVLIREDLNVPIKDGNITSTARIDAALPTLKLALAQGAKVLLMSHLGRPEEGAGQGNAVFSLKPVAKYLSAELGFEVPLIDAYLDAKPQVDAGKLVLLENVRFNRGEKANSDELARTYAALCDVFVMDAFGTAHRAQASTHGVAKYAPQAAAGPLLVAEIEHLEAALKAPQRPLLAIVGGAKVSTKLNVLESLASQVDQLVVGGGIANTFLAAQGYAVGRSLYEPDLLDQARRIMQQVSVPMPIDVMVGSEFSATAHAELKSVDEIESQDMIFDIGQRSQEQLASIVAQAGTIIWNGPVGVFEFSQFAAGTQRLAQAIADSLAFSIAGGGDTLAAVDKFAIADKVSYISTGGGAFLEYVEGKVLPALDILQQRAAE